MKVLLARETPSGDHILLGKTFVRDDALMFVHEAKRENWYRDLNSPYGVDVDVLDWLYATQVQMLHHYVHENNRLYVTTVSDVMAYGVFHQMPEGPRRYLPAPLWEIFEGRDYRCPWIENQKVFAWSGVSMIQSAALSALAGVVADAVDLEDALSVDGCMAAGLLQSPIQLDERPADLTEMAKATQ